MRAKLNTFDFFVFHQLLANITFTYVKPIDSNMVFKSDACLFR